MLAFTTTTFAQSGQKWSVDGNAVTGSEFIGTTNFSSLVLKTNNSPAITIKADGNIFIKTLTGAHTGIAMYDNGGMLLPLSFPDDDKLVLLGNGQFGNLPIPEFYWKLNSSNNNLYTNTPGNVGIGTNTPVMKLDVNGNAIVRGFLYVDNGVIIGKKIESKSVDSDTLTVNKILTTKEMYSDSLSTITVDAENLNATKAAAIGGAGGRITIDGPSSSIFSGSNIISFRNSDIKTTGTITANNLTINDLSSQKIVTTRITSPDSTIALGDSSVLFNKYLNRFFASQDENFKGIGIGFCYAKGINSTAIGSGQIYGDYSYFIGKDLLIPTGKTNSIIIGSGYNSANPLINNESNSLIVGFNSNIPTLVVTQATGGLGTTGNVGIGTNNPSKKITVNGDGYISGSLGIGIDLNTTNNTNGYMFAVNGKIGAKEVIIELDQTLWPTPDYVFDKKYELMPLSELEVYVNKYNHLPEIPSAYEVKEKGIHVGEMNTLLLKKIEELTLYIIQQQKMLMKQQQEIQVLNNKLKNK